MPRLGVRVPLSPPTVSGTDRSSSYAAGPSWQTPAMPAARGLCYARSVPAASTLSLVWVVRPPQIRRFGCRNRMLLLALRMVSSYLMDLTLGGG